MIAIRIAAAAGAAVVLVSMLMSAVKTFVVPRDEATALTRVVFHFVRVPFWAYARRRNRVEGHRIMRQFAPSALLVLPIVWMTVLWMCFAVFYWAIDAHGWRDAVEISGSSVTSLGSYRPEGLASILLSFVEAALGLGLIALLITYLPTIYAAYQRREREVSLLSVRAGTPPSAVEMLVRFDAVGSISDTADLWTGWEEWFVDLEESHLSQGSLAHFRSGLANHSWITASGTVLDAASLMLSSVNIEAEGRAALCIRSGAISLRHIADFFDIEYNPDPDPTDPISVTRAEFDEALRRFEAVGIPLKADRDQAWRDFAGWRVNYDDVLLELCSLVWAPPAPWSGDRAGTYRRPPITRRAGRGRRMRKASALKV